MENSFSNYAIFQRKLKSTRYPRANIKVVKTSNINPNNNFNNTNRKINKDYHKLASNNNNYFNQILTVLKKAYNMGIILTFFS
jgi:hypothetical protein